MFKVEIHLTKNALKLLMFSEMKFYYQYTVWLPLAQTTVVSKPLMEKYKLKTVS